VRYRGGATRPVSLVYALPGLPPFSFEFKWFYVISATKKKKSHKNFTNCELPIATKSRNKTRSMLASSECQNKTMKIRGVPNLDLKYSIFVLNIVGHIVQCQLES